MPKSSEQRLQDLPWRTARASGGGGCVEVARRGGLIAVRDSKNPEGAVLMYTPHEWDCFLDGARRGEFDDLALQ
jgi:Domain of unknown function (DUF397)